MKSFDKLVTRATIVALGDRDGDRSAGTSASAGPAAVSAGTATWRLLTGQVVPIDPNKRTEGPGDGLPEPDLLLEAQGS
jgi:hypothetical protein